MQSPTLNLSSCLRGKKSALLLSLLLAVAVTAHAQQPAPALPEWDQLTSEQRQQLTAPTRDRWNSASPEQRTRMLSRAERWQQMGPDERSRVSGTIARWQNLSPGKHDELRALFQYMYNLAESERATFLRRWIGMNADERAAFTKAHPAPPREDSSRRRTEHHRQAPKAP